MMYILLPAFVCLLVKLYLLRISIKTNKANNIFTFVLIVFIFHNVAEILMRVVYYLGHNPTFWFKTYYVSAVTGLTVLMLYAINVSRLAGKTAFLKYLLIISCAGLSSIILFTDQMVKGYILVNNLPNAEQGERYWLFKSGCNVLMLSIIAVLIIGYKKSTDHLQQNRCLYVLVAILPLIISCLAVMFLISRGQSNISLLLIPIASTFFSYALIKTETKHQLTDLRQHIPFSKEKKASDSIQDILSGYSLEKLSHKQAMNDIERVLVNYKNKKTNHNISHAAKSMDVPRSTLYAILKRLNMSTKDH